jgi:hypothetical protein
MPENQSVDSRGSGIMRMVKVLFMIVMAGLCVPASVLAQEYFFDFDSDEEGWVGVFTIPIIEWDDSFGNPAGSLRTSAAFSPCLQATTGDDGIWQIQADLFAEGTPGCDLDVYMYSEADCSDSALAVFGPDDPTAEEWVTRSFDSPVGLWPEQYFRLVVSRSSTSGVCYVDNVRAIGPIAPPAPIPTLDGYSQILLGLLLVGAGVVTLRRFQS